MVNTIRNINSIGNIKPIPVIHLIPPSADSDFKVVIESTSGDIDTHDFVVSGSWTDGVTTTIGSFNFKIIDPDKSIYNKISKFDEIVIYADYGNTITERFRGKIEIYGYTDSYLNISGKSIGMIFLNKNIIYSSNGKKKKSLILTEIINGRGVIGDVDYYPANFTNVDISNIENNDTEIEVNYSEIPFTDIISEICGSTHDFYLKYNYEAHYFTKGSRTNETECVVEDSNLIEVSNNDYDTTEVSTKIRVYGSDIQGIPIISTNEVGTSETGGIVKEYKIDNSSIVTKEQAEDYVSIEAERRRSTPKISGLSCLFLPSLQPGEKLYIAIPREEISPDYYEINSFTHEIDLNNEFCYKTIINIKNQKINLSSILKSRISFENKISENINPRNLDNSKIYDFSTNEGTFTTTQRYPIYSGNNITYVLKTTTGNSGSWTSPIYELSSNLSEVEFRISGESLSGTPPEGTKLEYSFDGGNTFYTWGNETVPQTTGNKLVIRINLSSSETQIKAVGVLYKLV